MHPQERIKIVLWSVSVTAKLQVLVHPVFRSGPTRIMQAAKWSL